MANPTLFDALPWCRIENSAIRAVEEYDERGFLTLTGGAETRRGPIASCLGPGYCEEFENGQLIQTRFEDASVSLSVRYEYDAEHRLVSLEATSPRSATTTTLQYDGRGRLASWDVADPGGGDRVVAVAGYDADGNMETIRVTDEAGDESLTTMGYSEDGLLSESARVSDGQSFEELSYVGSRNSDGHLLQFSVFTREDPNRAYQVNDASCLSEVFRAMPDRPFEERAVD